MWWSECELRHSSLKDTRVISRKEVAKSKSVFQQENKGWETEGDWSQFVGLKFDFAANFGPRKDH